MERDIVFLCSSGSERHYTIRVGQGVGETNLKISEEEAKKLFGQMEAYREEWKESDK